MIHTVDIDVSLLHASGVHFFATNSSEGKNLEHSLIQLLSRDAGLDVRISRVPKFDWSPVSDSSRRDERALTRRQR